MRSDSLLRLWGYINHLLTYLFVVILQISTSVQQTTVVVAITPSAVTLWAASRVPVVQDIPVMENTVQVSHAKDACYVSVCLRHDPSVIFSINLRFVSQSTLVYWKINQSMNHILWRGLSNNQLHQRRRRAGTDQR